MGTLRTRPAVWKETLDWERGCTVPSTETGLGAGGVRDCWSAVVGTGAGGAHGAAQAMTTAPVVTTGMAATRTRFMGWDLLFTWLLVRQDFSHREPGGAMCGEIGCGGGQRQHDAEP